MILGDLFWGNTWWESEIEEWVGADCFEGKEGEWEVVEVGGGVDAEFLMIVCHLSLKYETDFISIR